MTFPGGMMDRVSPKAARLLAWVERAAPILEAQVVGSGMSAALNELLRARKVAMTVHPTVKDRGGAPAAAVVLIGDWKS